ncbi:uncharacterized protein GGS22DRAFT_69836 [Annulohypoxylon maeteangense]|uniref:uncharacterized protein n=1 Tax=Annulohypoxylon maeteangense TaxID=1927788 RepID=UPI00200771AF|nr:uncharacterized protein GGS22DRAFT_69836 [Annulohypoxylon maeteangense]KAI0889320.1 hypothetical protein GGS22DRAFT_69836 [Annulohypoxylon maeteangense]
MDPVSAIGVSAAALQFAEITIKITKRIAVFAVLRDVPEDVEGPKAFIERLRSQLGLLNTTIRRIEEGLPNSNESLQDNELLELRNYISNLNRHGKRLDGLLNKYLPDDGASVPARLLAALKSIASDTEIKSAIDSVNELLPLLNTFLLTSIFAKGSLAFNQSRNIGAGMSYGLAHPDSSAIYQVTRNEVRHFIDRPELFTEIDRILGTGQIQLPKMAILQGMGGQGKTQLAIRYCGKARLEKKFQYILWVDASTRASTVHGLEEISESLNDGNQTLLDSDARVAFVRRRLNAAHLSWLLVFDNYDNPAAFDLREYMPKGPLGNVLITSRSADLERIGPVMRISGMNEEEAIKLLFALLDTPKNDKNRIAASEIVKRLGYLPLAIDQAGAYMKAEGVPLTSFLDHYEQSARDVLESVPNLWEYYESSASEAVEGMSNNTAKTVFTTWNLSFTLLKPDTLAGTLKVTILSLLAFFDEHAISEEFFEVYYSTMNPGQQPEWISLFVDEEGNWSSKKFDGVMRAFLRLSLITSLNTERADTKYASISLHPLVRDWINLRQEKSVHKANFTTFTRILAANLSATFWEDSVFLWGFRVSADQRRRLAEHLIPWMDVFKRHKSDLRPTIICKENERDLTTITAEQLIAKFFFDVDQEKNSYELSQWLWESCDVSDRAMLRVKFDAGNQQFISLHTTDEARNKSRENLQYWKSVLGNDSSGANMLHESHLVFVTSLVQSVYVEDKQECIDTCKAELEKLPNDEENMLLRHRILTELIYAAHYRYEYDICKKTCEILLNETERCGGDGYRKKIWSHRVWDAVVMVVTDISSDPELADHLSLLALEWATEKYGINQTSIVRFHLSRARFLQKMGRLVEAETMTRDCIVNGGVNRNHYIQIHLILGSILKNQGRFEEAYEAYSSALLQSRGTNIKTETLNLLDSCGEAASWFNIGLSDSHYTLMLSLSKKVQNWSSVFYATIRLYWVKLYIGTEVSIQDALALLVDTLTAYGIKFVYKKDYKEPTPLREIHTTIHLDELELLQHSIENEMVHNSLMESFGGSCCYGLNLLTYLATRLLEASSIDAAEHAFQLAFQLAKMEFDKRMDMDGQPARVFASDICNYTRLRFAVDKDEQRVRDILDWTSILVHKHAEGGMEGYHEEWWECQKEPLLDLIETRIQRARRRQSKAMRKISNRFSNMMGSKRFDLFLRPSIQHGLTRTSDIATLPERPAASQAHSNSVAGTSRS